MSPRPDDSSRWESPIKESLSNRRKIRTEPERILDAPGLKNDYYINVLDWSAYNVITVGLNNKAYTWEEKTGNVTEILAVPWPDHISCISFSPCGKHLAIGSEQGLLQIFDFIGKERKTRYIYKELDGVSSLGWNKHGLLARGDRNGAIKIYQLKQNGVKEVHSWKAPHIQRIVALKFSPDGRTLASGGNDNLVCLWDMAHMTDGPRKVLKEHTSAVRAMAWCPWETNVLATGGGLGDKTIKIFNTITGKCLHKVQTESQVCALVWSRAYRELLSSHASANEQLVIWSYPSMKKVTTMFGHLSRPLFVALSPDGQTVVTGAGDENLRFWKCFETKKGQKMLKCPSAALLEDPMPNIFR
ncbi:ubiquitin-protein transferase activating protein [Rhizophlyctis rosea]|nr:ubiquitin-protein transferase activating protein [Rhizophlyctis rosea]